jgi:hypothetical protein
MPVSRLLLIALMCLLGGAALAQAQAPNGEPPPKDSPPLTDSRPVNPPETGTANPASAPAGCRVLTDQAMAADFSAITAQSRKTELASQASLFQQAVALWTQAAGQCEGRSRDRALRSLDDDSRMLAGISEKLDSGPQCSAAHKDAAALQDIARQALGERRWQEASALFRKAENMWDYAVERCSGSQQVQASERRDQSETDAHNAEFCAPRFEAAREATQKLRAAGNSGSREQKQADSQVAETLWRDAIAQCHGAVVKDLASNNAVALARQRGTPWVATVAPRAEASVTGAEPGQPAAGAPPAIATSAAALAAAGAGVSLRTTSVAQAAALSPAGSGSALKAAAPLQPAALATLAGAGVAASAGQATPARPGAPAAAAAAAQAQPTGAVPAGTQMAGTTQFIGNFVRDADALTFSGSGRVVWASGDVFEGQLVKGLRQGPGVFTWANGHRYDGEWVNDLPSGQARVFFTNGNDYQGRVANGVPEGAGRMLYASGDSFEGRFKAGEPDEQGLYIWKNGQRFDGQWRNARPNGTGRLQFANGNVYQGSVVNGTPNGNGRLQFASGEVYSGQFLNGQPDGEGSFTWASGDQYVGQWKVGKKHGKGVFTWQSGERWEGIYEDDEQTGADSPAPKS